ncbi:hypothetical protein ACPWSR_03225 [Alloiococcus sp. CFN-8]|uniref:hypothetical protein n=1 Tax=Alloiococcus sp. CFN-8 TaxID=3416081 RepID=UPI003CEE97BA
MYKKTGFFLSIILILALFTGCAGGISAGKGPEKPPEISIKAEGVSLPWVVGLNVWDGAMYKREDTFKDFFNKKHEIIELKEGTEITIDFKGYKPDEVTVEDNILKDNGDLFLEGAEPKTIKDITWKGDKMTFVLEEDSETPSEVVINGYIIRGFRIKCTWGKNECEYAIVVKTKDQILSSDAQGYYQVFLELMDEDTGLQGDIKYIALDYKNALTENKKILEKLMEEYCIANGYELLLDDYEGLTEKGYINKQELYFPDGIIISFEDEKLQEDKLITNARKWRSGKGAIGATYTAIKENGVWKVDEAATRGQWIS